MSVAFVISNWNGAATKRRRAANRSCTETGKRHEIQNLIAVKCIPGGHFLRPCVWQPTHITSLLRHGRGSSWWSLQEIVCRFSLRPKLTTHVAWEVRVLERRTGTEVTFRPFWQYFVYFVTWKVTFCSVIQLEWVMLKTEEKTASKKVEKWQNCATKTHNCHFFWQLLLGGMEPGWGDAHVARSRTCYHWDNYAATRSGGRCAGNDFAAEPVPLSYHSGLSDGMSGRARRERLPYQVRFVYCFCMLLPRF